MSTGYSVEDPAEPLQYEIPCKVAWMPAEISWARITVIQHVFLCGFLQKLLRISIPFDFKNFFMASQSSVKLKVLIAGDQL